LVPIDTFAPPPPTGLVAVRSGEDVLLTWTEVERPDVTGYRVYRASAEEGPFTLLTESVLRVPSYSDTTVASGETYYFAVTAVDDAPLANESQRSELSAVTFAR
jgi:fibronectin type 3 domain-containing protein